MNTDNLFIKSRNLLTIVLLAFSWPAFAGAPFVTDDPEPVAEGKWEVNYAISKVWAHHSQSTTVPNIDINYGLTKNIQLHVQPSYSYQKVGDNKQSGFNNTEIGMKYCFLHQEQDGTEFMLGVYPKLQLPTGDQKLGEASGRVQAFLPLWAQLNTDKWIFYGGAGYKINNFSGGKDSWFLGGTAMYEVTDKLKIGGELFRETASAQGEKYTSGFNIGGVYNIAKDYHLLFSTGRALNNASETNRLSAFLALQVIY